jgi:hypothetical protein
VWLTSLAGDCGGGWLRSWSIFLLDYMNIEQSFVRWLVPLTRYM